MKTIIWRLVIASLVAASHVQANVKGVFAHFMVGNTASYTVADWQDDMTKAQAAHIDGFVLNMARGEATNGDTNLGNAFAVANNLGFKLLFSFDYAGNGLWAKGDVIRLINAYASNSAYYRRGSQPLVSTFEGPAASADWPDIKAATSCFFMPSWSSLGAAPAWAKGTADGLFSWAAWPEGPNSMSTFTDNSYRDALGGAPYMMPVSPWFYTNMPGFRKNWLWRGDTLWFDRWVHVMTMQPDYVQIISWNDYGESHHIGPLRSNAYAAFDAQHGKAPLNYALNKPHDGWRTFLPFLIDMAKANTTSFNQENVVAWYREQPGSACGTGGTTGNTASQLQQTYPPAVLAQDKIFYATLLGSAAAVSVSIGGQAVSGADWTITPSGGVGLYRGSVATGGRTGVVTITITRSGSPLLFAFGSNPITTTCTNGIANWNPSVIVGVSPHSISAVSPLSLSASVCTSGFGEPKYLDLCAFACTYGYCPPVCTCTSLGAALTKPVALNRNGCPAAGVDNTHLGLCSFGCNYGVCPPSLCTVYPAGHVCTAPNPAPPPVPVCTAGMADGAYGDLCSFACYYGFCPPEVCTCTQASPSGAGPASPAIVPGVSGGPGSGITTDYGLCAWTCKRGNCPADLCSCSGSGCSSFPGGGIGGNALTFGSPSNVAILGTIRGSLGVSPMVGGDGGFSPMMGGSNGGFAPMLGGPPGAQGQIMGNSGCTMRALCTNQNDPWQSRCQTDTVKLGFDRDGCEGGDHMGKSICCPTSSAVTECTWRGVGRDCNGQCHEGEAQLWTSRYGGSPSDSERSMCTRGSKAFCCKSVEYALAMRGCHWTGCWSNCDYNKEYKVTEKFVPEGFCNPWSRSTDLCCPKPVTLSQCRWVGTAPDCAEAKCDADEIAVDRDTYGDGNGCWWGRKKIACCKMNIPKPPTARVCPAYDWCGAFPLECALEEDDAMGFDPSTMMSPSLARRGEPRELISRVQNVPNLWSSRYPSRGPLIKLFQNRGDRQVPYYVVTALQIMMRFVEYLITGDLPGGGKSVLTRFTILWIFSVLLNELSLPPGLPPVSPTSPEMRQPIARLSEALGSNTNLDPFMLADRQMNQIKGALMGFEFPISLKKMEGLIRTAISRPGDQVATAKWLDYVRKTVSVFKYLQHQDVTSKLVGVVTNLRAQCAIIEQNTIGSTGLAHHWDEFWGAQTEQMAKFAHQVVLDYLKTVTEIYSQAQPADFTDVTGYVEEIISELGAIYIPRT